METFISDIYEVHCLTMPIKNLNLLLRPTPGGLQTHRNFISSQADRYLKLNLFSDLILLAPDGTTSCHQSLIVPLSPLLQTLLSSYPGLVHTIITPLSIHTVNSILDIVYTGTVSFTNRLDMDLVMAGLQLFGIHLPGLDSFQAAGTPLDCTMPRGRTVEGNNNDIPRPFSTPQFPQASTNYQPTKLNSSTAQNKIHARYPPSPSTNTKFDRAADSARQSAAHPGSRRVSPVQCGGVQESGVSRGAV